MQPCCHRFTSAATCCRKRRLSLRRSIMSVLAVAALMAAMIMALAGPVWAQEGPTPNGHNCAGTVVSSSAGPGFGQIVSDAAHQQAVDNFNLANCGNTERKNP